MTLSGEPDEAGRLARDGYLSWPGSVDVERVQRARLAIHRNLGRHGLHPERLAEFENASYCPELISDPDILALFYGTSLQRAAERWLGPLEPVHRAQIALRFPSNDPITPSPHLDGVSAPHNGVPAGTIMTFSALAGVYLSDVRENGGAFTVWPGTHLQHADFFRQRGPAALLNGVPDPSPATPRAVIGGPGHGFLAHYLLAHAVGSHCTPDIRYAVFFRLKARGHDDRGLRTMREPWLEWRVPPGLHDAKR